MESCKNCSLEEKIRTCCGRNPVTGERKRLVVGGKSYLACPDLTHDGACNAYTHLHRMCRDYQCSRLVYPPLERAEREMTRGYRERMFYGLKLNSSKLSNSKK